MKRSVYVLIFVLGLGVFSNDAALPKPIFLQSAEGLQSFLEKNDQGKELEVFLKLKKEPFLTVESMITLAFVFGKNTVTELNIQLAEKKGEMVDIHALKLFLPLLVQLQDLKGFSAYYGDAASTNFLLENLSQLNPGLEYLHLTSSGINDAGVARLAQLLPRIQRLQVLSLDNNEITNASSVLLATAFAQLPVFRAALLHRNNIEDQAAFAKAIASVRGNEKLRLEFPDKYVNGALDNTQATLEVLDQDNDKPKRGRGKQRDRRNRLFD